MGSGITCVFYINYFSVIYNILEERKPHLFSSLQGGGVMATIRQKVDKAFMEGKISNRDRFEFLDLINSGKLSNVELAKELMFLYLIDAMPV